MNHNLKSRSVLVVAAHPDDELLGCGGTLALHTDAGDHVTAVVVCEGESLRYGPGGVGLQGHTYGAAKILGVQNVRLLGFPDQGLDTKSLVEVIAPLEEIIGEVQPAVVYCQYGGDLNRDHELLFKASLVALRPTERFNEAIYAFYTVSSTEWAYPRTFIPDTWVDISSTLERKISAISCYKSEIKKYPHPRSLDALRYHAKACGNQVCVDAAEVFMTVRRTCRHGKTPV